MESKKMGLTDLEARISGSEIVYLDGGMLNRERPAFRLVENLSNGFISFANKREINLTQLDQSEIESLDKLTEVSQYSVAKTYGSEAGRLGNLVLSHICNERVKRLYTETLRQSEQEREKNLSKKMKYNLFGLLCAVPLCACGVAVANRLSGKGSIFEEAIDKGLSDKLKAHRDSLTQEEISSTGLNKKARNYLKRNLDYFLNGTYPEENGKLNFDLTGGLCLNDEVSLTSCLLHSACSGKQTSFLTYDKDFISSNILDSLKVLESSKEGTPFSIYRVDQNTGEVEEKKLNLPPMKDLAKILLNHYTKGLPRRVAYFSEHSQGAYSSIAKYSNFFTKVETAGYLAGLGFGCNVVYKLMTDSAYLLNAANFLSELPLLYQVGFFSLPISFFALGPRYLRDNFKDARNYSNEFKKCQDSNSLE